MKTLLNKLVIFSVLTLLFYSCEKDETRTIAHDGTNPTLTVSETEIILLEDSAANVAVTFSWTPSDFGFDGLVGYILQFDKKGNNFAAPSEVIADTLQKTLTVVDLNDVATDLNLATDVPSDIEVRVKAQINNSFTPAYSSASTIIVTPYAGKPTELFLVGGSTAADWNPTNAIALKSLGEGKFESYQYMTIAGDGFKLLPKKGVYDGDLGMKKGTPGELVSDNEDNVPVAANGFYLVKVNMSTGKKGTYELVPMQWGIIGDATPGSWDNSTPMQLKEATKSNYTWTITLNLIGGKQYKFRANDAWDVNLGSTLAGDGDDKGPTGTLKQDGKNLGLTADGNYTVDLILAPEGYTYTIKKN